ncbi:dual OB domain-containing protein [Nocardia camponoti]|uniref:Dual OB-containing domain-containing protein n=1 Tax=Nocardia camponoti TaxID=1616106 RepID=A0A917V6X1_9NOCA|nr:hypothetical protein [Nocardia camponoti]GGK44939.1 hypothetical protein GCM10011591_15670 [Nocardia camponoti]
MVTKLLLCLANSYKDGDRCVAGIDPETRKWFRLVSSREGGAVHLRDRQCPAKGEPRLLDRLSVMLSEPCPYGFQQENWLFQGGRLWVNMGRAGWDEACSLAERPDTLWLNGCHSEPGVNNCVPVARRNEVRDSLKLIHLGEVGITVSAPYEGRHRARAKFQYNGIRHILPVTDPEFLERCKIRGAGDYRLGESLLTVSLAGQHVDQKFHKLVAGIVQRGHQETGTRL